MIYSPMRIGGLASGMDIDQMVNDLMKAERLRYDKLYQQKQVMEWQKQDYRAINLKLRTLNNASFDMKLSSSYMKYKAVGAMDDGSDYERYFTASAGAGAIPGNYTVEVKQLAENAKLKSKGLSEGFKINSPLKDQEDFNGIENISFTITGDEGPVSFSYSENATLSDILRDITNSNAGVKAYYDEISKKVVLASKKTGEDATIKITDNEGSNFVEKLEFNKNIAVGAAVKGQNAKIVINGNTVENQSNDFTIGGIRFNLFQAMPKDADGAVIQKANIRITQDTDAAAENIKKYIDLYNETIDAISTKTTEERYRKFPPLTDAQKKEMSEEDIKLWEEKAKSGLLRSDPLLTGITSKMRHAIFEKVEGQPKGMENLAAIGITTKDWKEMGKLHVDEDKLKAALDKDPKAVMRLFNASGESSSSQGIANKIYDISKAAMKDLTDKAGGAEFEKIDNSFLGKKIRDMDKRISDMEDKLMRTEERYWMKFTRMEQAIQYANQQSMWLASQMGMYMGG